MSNRKPRKSPDRATLSQDDRKVSPNLRRVFGYLVPKLGRANLAALSEIVSKEVVQRLRS